MKQSKNLLAGKRDTLISFGIVIVAFIVVQIMILTGNISSSLKGQLVPICAYIVMAVSLNLTVGILGELSLGHPGFMSVGAFAGIVATTSLAETIPFAPLRLAIAMVIGAICAAIAGVIVTKPEVLILDEPAAGMNPQESTELMRFIRHIRDEFDLTILLIEHDMKVVMGVCQYIWVLEYGQLIAEGDPDAIRNNPRVIEAYLGEDVSNHA